MRALSDPVAFCRPYLSGYPVDGVAISTLGSAFGGETIAASDDTAARLDEIQLDLGQGPCWEAIAIGLPVLVDDMRVDRRWPLFSDAVTAIDVCAVFALPMALAGFAVGVIDLYAREPRHLESSHVADLVASSALTAVQVLAEVLTDSDDEHSGNPRSRRVVHQATGMVMAFYRIPADDALLLLRAHAFAAGRSVIEVATEVVAERNGSLDDVAQGGGGRG